MIESSWEEVGIEEFIYNEHVMINVGAKMCAVSVLSTFLVGQINKIETIVYCYSAVFVTVCVKITLLVYLLISAVSMHIQLDYYFFLVSRMNHYLLFQFL